ncbi:MAG: tRNA (adenosine(37)-N6)-threonylcarbamoyltransferase complex ATPase subunit type 1 TsaE [Candidatus Vogelbacteria bacterium]|nr:tRNA (adenosine(37)-N6)-threonylcarbamoyltransferase complex ATPase subunit type 1 TsaE [Candidatus Vogelbacteria bacterium]
MARQVITKSLKETHDVARGFYSWLTQQPNGSGTGHIVCLRGDLGAGKTSFTQGLALAMGVEDNITSPTFVLMKKYKGLNEKNLVHFDVYRLENSKDLEPLRFEEYVGNLNNIVVVEWPEKIGEALPAHAHTVLFKFIDENTREITLPYE